MAKTRITTDTNGSVTIEYDHAIHDERITRTFRCPVDGGYVREGNSQVCDRLQSRGSTLMCSSRSALPGLIRREYRAMRRAESNIE